jgi:AcrR family transcriptional regulator
LEDPVGASIQPTRRERASQQRRIEILEAAEAVFAEKGFVSAKMGDIAAEAELSVGTLYNVFDNKGDLYKELLRMRSLDIERRFDEALSRGGTPAEKVERLCRAKLDYFWEHRRFFRLFFHETAATLRDPRAGFTPEMQERYDAHERRLEAIFQEGVDMGSFRPVNARVLMLAFDGMARNYLAHASLQEAPERNREDEEDLIRTFFDGAAAPGSSPTLNPSRTSTPETDV